MKPILVFDETVGSGAVYSQPDFNKFLGMYDKYSFHLVASANGLATPGTITAQLEHGSDERNWTNKNGTAEINAQALSQTAQSSYLGNDLGTIVSQGFGRIRVQCSATTSTCRVKVYATGRKA